MNINDIIRKSNRGSVLSAEERAALRRHRNQQPIQSVADDTDIIAMNRMIDAGIATIITFDTPTNNNSDSSSNDCSFGGGDSGGGGSSSDW